ncbi:MAG: GNAT family N-acetyltransferase [Gemmatimonadaceae bacterium]|nr:GNAT family N-acetyltransferase [Gemmatimonadaceae bacterium]
MPTYAFSDIALSRRLERTEAAANASFVDARSRIATAIGATWIDVEGTWAMFDGVDSPLTQTFGLGMFSELQASSLDVIEQFFVSRSSTVYHEVSPLADPATMGMLNERGYRPIEQSSVMHRPLPADLQPTHADLHVRQIDASEIAMWANTSAAGWGEYPELGDFMRDIGTVMASARNNYCFVAEIDHVPVATAALSMHEGVALLAGASTVPAYRGRGAQNALLQARLSFAETRGAEIAMMVAQPGSASQRNAERQGFRIAYTRTKWGKA